MLTRLSVQNFALIDHLDLNFDDGLSIITGETGAGKSILLGALGLVLGNRADLSSLRDPSTKCIIEAEFDIKGYQLEGFFETHDLDYENPTIIRREILPSGKSRAFVNDSPVRLDILQPLAGRLVDIHSQHQTLQLGNSKFQLELMDALSSKKNLSEEYSRALKDYRNKKRELEALVVSLAEARKSEDYNKFLLNELQQADLNDGEQEEMEQQLEQLNHAEEIKLKLSQATQLLGADDSGILDLLTQLQQATGSLSGYSKDLEEVAQRAESALIELKDLHQELEQMEEATEYDPMRIAQYNERLQLIYSLQKKHIVSSVSELLEIQAQLEQTVSLTDNMDEQLADLEQEVAALRQDTYALGLQLHEERSGVKQQLIAALEQLIHRLGMPNAHIAIELEAGEELLDNGIDKIRFLLAANKGGSFKAIEKAASGGELSRIMLAVKTVLSAHSELPTVIFDEIDTGVSGDIADKMGAVMQEMGCNMQVIAITHLPQIAAKGKSHFKVYKEDGSESTISQVVRLGNEERISEIAKMLSGEVVNDTALEHARALLL